MIAKAPEIPAALTTHDDGILCSFMKDAGGGCGVWVVPA